MSLFDEIITDIRDAQLGATISKTLTEKEVTELVNSAHFYAVPGVPYTFVLDRNVVSKERAQRFRRVAFEITGIEKVLLARLLKEDPAQLRWVSEIARSKGEEANE